MTGHGREPRRPNTAKMPRVGDTNVFPIPAVPVAAGPEDDAPVIRSVVRPPSAPESTWVPPPSRSDLRLEPPPRGNRFLAGTAFGFMLAGVAVIALWLLQPDLFSRDAPPPATPVAQTAPRPATPKPLPSGERVRELEKQLAESRRKHDDSVRELELAQATREQSDQLLASIARTLVDAKRLPHPPALSPKIVARLVKEHQDARQVIGALAAELKTSPEGLAKAISQLIDARQLLELEKKQFAAELDVTKERLQKTPFNTMPTIATEPASSVPPVQGNTGAPSPTTSAVTAGSPSAIAPLGTSALGGQPIGPVNSRPRGPGRFGY